MKHYYLKQRDTIRAGDEIRSNWGTWHEVLSKDVGQKKGKLYAHFDKIRRALKAGDKISDEKK